MLLLGTTPETGKHLLSTPKNFTCSAKQDLELDVASCGDQPTHNTEAGHTQNQVNSTDGVEHEVDNGDHPPKPR